MSKKMTGLSKKLTWGGVIAALGTLLVFVGPEVGIELFDRLSGASERSAVVKEIERFESESYIVDVNSDENGTSITYYTCKAPKLDYSIAISINGEVVVKKEFDAADFPERYTNECFSWTPSPHSFTLSPGDVLVVVWNYGEYGRFEMTWEEPDV